MKKITLSILTFLLVLSNFFYNVKAESSKEEIKDEYYTEYFLPEPDIEEEKSALLEKIQSENLLIPQSKYYYDSVLEFYATTAERKTGFRLAGNQPTEGTNFGSNGGMFWYNDGNNNAPVTLSFSVSGFSFSLGVGVGNVTSAGVGAYNINAPANKYCKLYVNRGVKVNVYKLYHVYSDGRKEFQGYVQSNPFTSSLAFDVR